VYKRSMRTWFFIVLLVCSFSIHAFALEFLGGAMVDDIEFSIQGVARLWFTPSFSLNLTGYPLEGVSVLRTMGEGGLKPFFGVGIVKKDDNWSFSTDAIELSIGLELDIDWIMPDYRISIDFRNSADKHYTTVSLLYNISSLFDFQRISDDDAELLARLISSEARGEPYEGQVAVGAVVLNRLKSPEFPDTVKDVIYQNGQFTPVANGTINASPNESGIAAAKEALSGSDPSKGALYYCNPSIASASGLGFMAKRVITTTIGQHVFYK
jgi:hypothetical protein